MAFANGIGIYYKSIYLNINRKRQRLVTLPSRWADAGVIAKESNAQMAGMAVKVPGAGQ
jgi:hypothetical protein